MHEDLTNRFSVIKGYFVPEVDGKYRFTMNDDDWGALYMSVPDSDPTAGTEEFTMDPANSR